MNHQIDIDSLLSETQKNQKKQLLLDLEKEIQKLENQIRYSKAKKLKYQILKSTKISLRAGKLFAPYILTAGITFGGFKLFHHTPFIIDETSHSTTLIQTLDNLGTTRFQEKNIPFQKTTGTLFYIGKWEKTLNGYIREKKVYSIDPLEAYNWLNNPSLSSLQTPVSSIIEEKQSITEMEENEKPYLQAILYFPSKKNSIIIKQDLEENIFETYIWGVITFILEVLLFMQRYHHSEHYLSKFVFDIEEIQKQYPTINRKEFIKKLEITKNNYNRLRR